MVKLVKMNNATPIFLSSILTNDNPEDFRTCFNHEFVLEENREYYISLALLEMIKSWYNIDSK